MSVYGKTRKIETAPGDVCAEGLPMNEPLRMDGLKLLRAVNAERVPVVFFDPQYRGIMDKMNYGNEGARQKKRAELTQMSDRQITKFIGAIDRILIKSGHLFLWIDKFHLCEGVDRWLAGTELEVVDLITWDKRRMGMGYRTRRQAEHLLILQKRPIRAKGVWTRHDIRDVWSEAAPDYCRHAHPKPIGLQQALIEATTGPDDVVVDPSAGSFSVLVAARRAGRRFLGCDVKCAREMIYHISKAIADGRAGE